MRKLILVFIFSFLFGDLAMAGQSAATYYSAGNQTNPGANTILANTGALNSGGILGANYEVTVLLNGSGAQDYKFEVLNGLGSVVQTIWFSAPANQITQINPKANFFIPNGYSARIRNNTGVILGGTLQASIILQITELVDK